ncbi:MAG: NAD(P)/FAD-dependent oxidoreductase [Halodesulfurarchaeum sp.]
MQEFDSIVLGGGTGNIVASAAADEGLDTAIVEWGPLGGTCLNRGCNPSKKLIHRADVLETIRNAQSFGIDVSLGDIPFEKFVTDVTSTVSEVAEAKARRARDHENVTFFHCDGQFVDERVVEVQTGDTSERITSETVVLAGGSRPSIPDGIDGTDDVEFLTSEEALRLETRPDRLVIVGGGYIAVELGHFFTQMGTDVTIVGSGDVLLDREDRDVAERLTSAYRRTHDLALGYRVVEIEEEEGTKIATGESETGERITVRGEELLLATGRRPNSDRWNVAAGDLETTDEGFVETNQYLETTVDGVWAIGDIAGNYMFKHSGDKEAEYVIRNAVNNRRESVEYPGMAHAVFGSPQLASLGKTESELAADREYEVGTFEYDSTALGEALSSETGFAKAIVGDDDDVLGFHIVGPQAATLIHEVSTAVAAGASALQLAETIHIHPALSEVVQGAFRDVRPVAPSGF